MLRNKGNMKSLDSLYRAIQKRRGISTNTLVNTCGYTMDQIYELEKSGKISFVQYQPPENSGTIRKYILCFAGSIQILTKDKI